MACVEQQGGSGPRPQTCDEIIALIRSNQRELDALGVKQLSLFGSAVRGDLGPESDVDMVVEFSHTTYRRFVGLKSLLESLLGRKVDLLTPPAVQGRFKEEVERDLVHVPR